MRVYDTFGKPGKILFWIWIGINTGWYIYWAYYVISTWRFLHGLQAELPIWIMFWMG